MIGSFTKEANGIILEEMKQCWVATRIGGTGTILVHMGRGLAWIPGLLWEVAWSKLRGSWIAVRICGLVILLRAAPVIVGVQGPDGVPGCALKQSF